MLCVFNYTRPLRLSRNMMREIVFGVNCAVRWNKSHLCKSSVFSYYCTLHKCYNVRFSFTKSPCLPVMEFLNY